MDELWDIARVAEYLSVSERTVYNKVRAGELPASKVGRLWRVRLEDVDAWLARGRIKRGGAEPGASGSGGGGPDAAVTEPGPYPLTRVDAPTPAERAAIPDRAELDALLADLEDTLTRRLAFVGLLTRAYGALGWPAPIVVGGNAVEFYTMGDYPTQDIDLVGASEPFDEVLAGWGFAKQGRHWYDNELGLVVESPGARLTPDERDHVISVEVGPVSAYVLGIEDLIVDRLAACVHWADAESCRWASVLIKCADELDAEYLSRRCREEQLADAFVELGGGR